MKRKHLTLLLVFAFVLLLAVPALAAPKVVMDTQEVSYEIPLLIEQGRLLVPLRPFSETLSGAVTWDNTTNTVIVTRQGVEVKLTVGQTTVYVNNVPETLDVPAKIINGRIWVPLRFISERLKAKVTWDQAAQSAVITTESDSNPIYIFGSSVSFAPFEFYTADGKITGFDIELLNAISEEANIDIEIKEMEFPELFPALKEAQIDGAISAITVTEMRQQIFDFSVPYFLYGQCVTVRSDNQDISSFNDLEGKIIGVRTGTVAYDEVIKLPDVKVVGYESVDEAFQALKDGALDAIISDFPGTAYYIREGNKNIKIVGDTIINQPIAIAFPKNNSQLPVAQQNPIQPGLTPFK